MYTQTRNMNSMVKEILTALLSDDTFINTLADKMFERLNQRFEKQLNKLKTATTELVDKCKQLEDKIDQQEQYSRRNCIRVFGVPESSRENTDELVLDVFKNHLQIDMESNMIDRTHRTGKKTSSTSSQSSSKPRPIIVKFTSYKSRSLVIRSRKLLKGSNISIKEDLTRTKHQLLIAASKKYGFKNVWSNDGSIFAKENGTIKKILYSDFNNF